VTHEERARAAKTTVAVRPKSRPLGAPPRKDRDRGEAQLVVLVWGCRDVRSRSERTAERRIVVRSHAARPRRQRRRPRRRVERVTHRLAVEGHGLASGRAGERLHPGGEAAAERLRLEPREAAAERVGARHALGQAQEAAEPAPPWRGRRRPCRPTRRRPRSRRTTRSRGGQVGHAGACARRAGRAGQRNALRNPSCPLERRVVSAWGKAGHPYRGTTPYACSDSGLALDGPSKAAGLAGPEPLRKRGGTTQPLSRRRRRARLHASHIPVRSGSRSTGVLAGRLRALRRPRGRLAADARPPFD
jgi:hypothetical protein